VNSPATDPVIERIADALASIFRAFSDEGLVVPRAVAV